MRLILCASLLVSALLAAESSLNPLQNFDDFVQEHHGRREAQRQVDEKDYKGAAGAYERLAEEAVGNPAEAAMNYLSAAECYMLAGKANRARKTYTLVVDKYLFYVPLQTLVEQLRELAENFAQGKGTVLGLHDPLASIDIYRQIIKIQPDIHHSLNDRMALAAKLAAEDELVEAVNTYQDIIKLSPRNPEVRLTLARLLYRQTLDKDGDGQYGRAAIREARSFLEFAGHADSRRLEAEQIILECREKEAERIISRANFYLNKYHYRPEVARRYLYDCCREYPETHGALEAAVLIEKNFKEQEEEPAK